MSCESYVVSMHSVSIDENESNNITLQPKNKRCNLCMKGNSLGASPAGNGRLKTVSVACLVDNPLLGNADLKGGANSGQTQDCDSRRCVNIDKLVLAVVAVQTSTIEVLIQKQISDYRYITLTETGVSPGRSCTTQRRRRRCFENSVHGAPTPFVGRSQMSGRCNQSSK